MSLNKEETLQALLLQVKGKLRVMTTKEYSRFSEPESKHQM